MRYVALIHKDKDSSYGVSFPDFPGCISAGSTIDEATSNAEPVPDAHSIEAIRKDTSLRDILPDAAFAYVPPDPGSRDWRRPEV